MERWRGGGWGEREGREVLGLVVFWITDGLEGYGKLVLS